MNISKKVALELIHLLIFCVKKMDGILYSIMFLRVS